MGTPCNNDFTVVADYESLAPPDPSISPKGAYRATTTEIFNDDRTFSAVTTLTNVQTGNIENVVEWKHRGGLGGLGLGGQWLTENRFLIHETLDQGPLLINVGKEVTQLIPKVFGTSNLSNYAGVRATAATVANTDTYHIVLFGSAGVEADLPKLRLYHPETNEVEQLPAR